MFFAVLAVAGQIERNYIREKTLEGQVIAASKGNHGGRPKSLQLRNPSPASDSGRAGMRLPAVALGMSDRTAHVVSPCLWREAALREQTPETHVIDYRAAEQLLAARDPRGAVKLLDSVIAVHPENTAARLLRARAFFAAAQLRPAELEFQIVLEREPDNAFAHFALGRTLERASRPDEAQRHFRLAAALDPRPDYVEAARFDMGD